LSASAGGVTKSALLTVSPPTAPPPLTISSLTLSPTSVAGGTPSQGTVTLSAAAPMGGASVSLLSSNTTAATVPPSVTVPARSSGATFAVTTKPVTASTSVTISATFGGLTKTATLTVSPATPVDTVAVTLAEYKVADQILNVEATSTSASATLQGFVTSTGARIGTLSNAGGGTYQGQFSWPVNPQSITVRSNLGGSATTAVQAKQWVEERRGRQFPHATDFLRKYPYGLFSCGGGCRPRLHGRFSGQAPTSSQSS